MIEFKTRKKCGITRDSRVCLKSGNRPNVSFNAASRLFRAGLRQKYFMAKIRVLINENETLVRVGVRTILSSNDDFEIVGEARTTEKGFELFKKSNADATLMSLRFAGTCAIDEIGKFLQFAPKAKIIVLASSAGDVEISSSLKMGAFGYICKDVSEEGLIKAVRAVAAGRKYIPNDVAGILSENIGQEQLTNAEKRILELIVAGKSNKKIACNLNISENTVKTHVRNIFDKINVSDRTSAATTAIKRGLVRIDT